ncbi:MAG: histidinol-phosphate transaminase [Candidatus Dormibacteria bacterium]
MSRFRRASLGDDFGYTPGEQPDAAAWLKLNTNEAPLGPSPRVADALRDAAAELRLYPDPGGEPLRSAIARHHAVDVRQVFIANGGDQVLDCCCRAFIEPGARLLHTSPTYSLFPVLARMFSARDDPMGLLPDGALPLGFASRRAPLRFVVNPNSPTGRWIEPEELQRALSDVQGVVVIDEAYADFAPESCIPLLDRHDNWIVLRSFSKGYALAGLRVGYAVANAALIDDLLAVKDSYPVDRCAIAGARAALEDREHHARIVETVRVQRERLCSALRDMGWDVMPSEANFVFTEPPSPVRAVDVAARLREQRILVRHFTSPPLDTRLRISIGDADEVDRLLQALRA